MRILITGGAGFIGKHLTSYLNSKSEDVTVIDSLIWGQKAPNNTKFIYCDLSVIKNLEQLINIDFDVLIHLAAYSFIPDCEEKTDLAIINNLTVLNNILDVVQNKDIKIIFSSSAAVYSISEKQHEEDEICYPNSVYGMIKYICEKRLEQFWNKTGIPVCILRLTNVYGMNDYQSHLIPEIFQQILSGQTIINVGNLFSRRDYVYVKDVAKIIGKKIYDNFKFEITNVATGSCYSVIDILDIISSVKKIKYEGSSINSKIRKVDSTLVALSNNKLMQFYCKPLTELHEGLKHLCTDLKL